MSTKKTRPSHTHGPRSAVHLGGATPATIVALEDDRASVRLAAGPSTREVSARLALIAGWVPTLGDRVLVSGDADEIWVIGVIKAASPPAVTGAMTLPDGGSIALDGTAVELRDAAGRLLVRYADGSAEIAAPTGDLVLDAPSGRVVLRSGLDVSVEAARDVVHRAGRSMALGVATAEPAIAISPRSVDVRSERVSVAAKQSEARVDEVTTVARAIATRTSTLAITAERYELSATKLVEKARDAFRDVTDLAQSRIGRVRTIVAGAYSQRAQRTVIVSKDDTSIDGRKIHLG
jgi:phage baseplate assembly protein gpV